MLVSGSADKEVKFWQIDSTVRQLLVHYSCWLRMMQEGQNLVHARTLKMSDDILSARFSPNGKLLAVALLDATVKVFYQDSLKFFLSLYGHKVRSLTLVGRFGPLTSF